MFRSPQCLLFRYQLLSEDSGFFTTGGIDKGAMAGTQKKEPHPQEQVPTAGAAHDRALAKHNSIQRSNEIHFTSEVQLGQRVALMGIVEQQ